MMTRLYTLYFLLLLSVLVSCSEPAEEVPLMISTDTAIDSQKYPSHFTNLSKAFHSTCENDFLMKPISIQRPDISNKKVTLNAWHFESVGETTVDFSNPWLEQFFADSTAHDLLRKKGSRKANLDSWIKKNGPSGYIYSDETELTEYKDTPIYDDLNTLKAKIENDICESGLATVAVFINPDALASMRPEPRAEEKVNHFNPSENAQSSLACSGLCQELEKSLNDMLKSDDEHWRIDEADRIANLYFGNRAYVEKHNIGLADIVDVWDRGKFKYYLNELAISESIKSIRIVDFGLNSTNDRFDFLKTEHTIKR